MCRQTRSVTLAFLSASVLVLALAPPTADADTIYVCWDGSGDYLTIQEGIDAASDGDEVVVCDGTYTGDSNRDLDFHGKAITVRSENGPDNCIIDCQGSEDDQHRGFYFRTGETADATVEGFTITNGWANGGGGIYCLGSNPTVTTCTFSGNSANFGGGIFNNYHSNPTVTNCTFSGNIATFNGGGIGNYDLSNANIANCTFSGNSAVCGGGTCNFEASPTVTNSAFSGNSADYGGGMYNQSSNPTVTNCTFSGNEADQGGGMLNWSGDPTLANCILWDDNPDEIVDDGGAGTTVSYSDVQGGWPGQGNIDADPLFAGPTDYHLLPGSPCIDAGCNWGVPRDFADLDDDGDTTEITPLDLDGEGRFFDDPDTGDTGCGCPPVVDMGAYELGDTGPQPCPGDLDCDRVVGHSDLGILLAAWQNADDGDLNCDGVTNHSDLGILLAHWGQMCP